MSFDWMQTDIPDAVQARGGESRVAMVVDEVRERAALLKRLGYSQDHALRRCQGNVDWSYAVAGKAAISKADIKRIVGEVYAR